MGTMMTDTDMRHRSHGGELNTIDWLVKYIGDRAKLALDGGAEVSRRDIMLAAELSERSPNTISFYLGSAQYYGYCRPERSRPGVPSRRPELFSRPRRGRYRLTDKGLSRYRGIVHDLAHERASVRFTYLSEAGSATGSEVAESRPVKFPSRELADFLGVPRVPKDSLSLPPAVDNCLNDQLRELRAAEAELPVKPELAASLNSIFPAQLNLSIVRDDPGMSYEDTYYLILDLKYGCSMAELNAVTQLLGVDDTEQSNVEVVDGRLQLTVWNWVEDSDWEAPRREDGRPHPGMEWELPDHYDWGLL